MDIGPVIHLLQERYHCTIGTGYYTKIEKWQAWWRGFYKPFHRYIQKGTKGEPIERHLYSLRMAKKVCEDWAAILLNEKTTLTIDDEASSLFVQGEDGTGGVFADTAFWQRGNELVEHAFMSGTGAFVLRVNGMRVRENGAVLPDGQAKIGLEYLDAPCIIPLSVVGRRITEVAFVSAQIKRGKQYVYLETHTLEQSGYVITNEYFQYDNGGLKKENLPDGIAPRMETGSDIPWFAIVRPNTANHYPDAHGLGMSIYADALDTLMGVDLAYNNFCRDFMLGGKKVFYNKSLLKTLDDGTQITPDDMMQQLFCMLGDSMDFDVKEMVQEYNPSLRVEENRSAVQAQLDYLSFKCGLGARRYRFDSEKMQTATEYNGSRQDLVQNASKHYIVIEQALQEIVRAILFAGKTFCGAPVNPDCKITVNFEDSYIMDKEAERQRDLQEIRDGLMQKYEYRMKWRGEDEQTAKAMVAPSDAALMGFE